MDTHTAPSPPTCAGSSARPPTGVTAIAAFVDGWAAGAGREPVHLGVPGPAAGLGVPRTLPRHAGRTVEPFALHRSTFGRLQHAA